MFPAVLRVSAMCAENDEGIRMCGLSSSSRLTNCPVSNACFRQPRPIYPGDVPRWLSERVICRLCYCSWRGGGFDTRRCCAATEAIKCCLRGHTPRDNGLPHFVEFNFSMYLNTPESRPLKRLRTVDRQTGIYSRVLFCLDISITSQL